MNSRDRTFLALEHRLGDRIPIDFWATTAVAQRLKTESGKPYAEFLDDYDVDLRYIDGPTYIGPPLAQGEDIWGVKRAAVAAGSPGQSESYSEVTEAPLGSAATPEDIEAYDHWPDPDMFDYDVVLDPQNIKVGTIGEDYALESLPGDTITLGTHTWQILGIEGLKMKVKGKCLAAEGQKR